MLFFSRFWKPKQTLAVSRLDRPKFEVPIQSPPHIPIAPPLPDSTAPKPPVKLIPWVKSQSKLMLSNLKSLRSWFGSSFKGLPLHGKNEVKSAHDGVSGKGASATTGTDAQTPPPSWLPGDVEVVALGDRDRWMNLFFYLPTVKVITTTDQLYQLRRMSDRPGGRGWSSELDLYTISPHHRIFLSHRWAVASDDLDKLETLLHLLSDRDWRDWHIHVRNGSPVEDNQRAQLHLEHIELYYRTMANVPHLRRGEGGILGRGEEDAAPWGTRWEWDRKKVQSLFEEQKGEGLIFGRGQIHTVEQIKSTLGVVVDSLANDDRISPQEHVTTILQNGKSIEFDYVERDGAKTAERALTCRILAEVARYQAGVYKSRKRLVKVNARLRGALFQVINVLLFGVPRMYSRRISSLHEGIAGDNKYTWNCFYAHLVTEWLSINLITSLLLSSAITMVGAVDISPATRMSGLVTSILAIASVVTPIFLIWTHQPGNGKELSKLYFKSSPTVFAIIISLPVSLLLWALLWFVAAICFWSREPKPAKGENEPSPRARAVAWTPVGVAGSALILVIFIVWNFHHVLAPSSGRSRPGKPAVDKPWRRYWSEDETRKAITPPAVVAPQKPVVNAVAGPSGSVAP